MLAKQGQRLGISGLLVLEPDLAYPLGIGGRSSVPGQAVLVVAGLHAIITTIGALVGVDQHAPAYGIRDRFIGHPGVADFMHEYTGSHSEAQRGLRGVAQEATAVDVDT